MFQKSSHEPDANPHKLAGKTIEQWSLVFWSPKKPHANQDITFVKKAEEKSRKEIVSTGAHSSEMLQKTVRNQDFRLE